MLYARFIVESDTGRILLGNNLFIVSIVPPDDLENPHVYYMALTPRAEEAVKQQKAVCVYITNDPFITGHKLNYMIDLA